MRGLATVLQNISQYIRSNALCLLRPSCVYVILHLNIVASVAMNIFERANANNMNLVLYPFMVLAAVGLALSVVAHGMALAGLQLPGGQMVWMLHVGIFVVWLPTILVAYGATRYANRKDFWKVALAGCPAWMRRALYMLFAYGVFNFIIFMFGTGHDLHPSGDAPPSIVRGFSGHWMIFYGAAFATLYSAIHAPQLFRERTCPNGHSVAPTVRFCPECGHAFPQDSGNS